MALWCKIIESPVGDLKLVASGSGIVAILWGKGDLDRVRFGSDAPIYRDDTSHLLQAENELREYFAGGRTRFSVPLDMRGTPFQKRVWEALLAIPYGETRTYGQLASQLGNPEASRAVGAANGRNPLSIVVPCHRVIGSTGKLTGFAGGMEAKAYLLELEASDRRLF